MTINVIVQYNSGFLPDIFMLTQASIVVVWFDGTVFVYYDYPFNYTLHYLLFCSVWWPCIATV